MGHKFVPRLYPMPKTTRTTVTQDDRGYYRVRIPKSLADAMGLAGEKVQWDVESSEALIMRKDD